MKKINFHVKWLVRLSLFILPILSYSQENNPYLFPNSVNIPSPVSNTGLGSSQNKNTSFGLWNLRNVTGEYNTAIGTYVLSAGTNGLPNNTLIPNTGKGNTAVGNRLLVNNTTGEHNVAIGTGSLLQNSSGSRNIAVGYEALWYNRIGKDNIAIGRWALRYNDTGQYNVATGFLTLHNNTFGNRNIASGFSALYSNTLGAYNIGFGSSALFNNTAGTYNIAIGTNSLYNNNGQNNIAIGTNALKLNNTGNHNIAIGNASGHDLLGNNNILLGLDSGLDFQTGNNNIIIGSDGNGYDDGSNNIILGKGVTNSGSVTENVIVSNNGKERFRVISNGKMGIGNYSPTAAGGNGDPTERLDVEGNGRFRDIPDVGGESIILGKQIGTDPEDVKLSRLAFPNDYTQVLLGDGTWGTINSGGGSGFVGCSSTSTAADLTENSKINLNGYNFYFTGGENQEYVAIGYECNDILKGKLSVTAVDADIAGFFESQGGGPLADKVSVVGNTSGGNNTNIGISGSARDAVTNIGVYGIANGGGSSTNWAGYFVGDVFGSGVLLNASDENLKKDIQPIENALNVISKLNSKTYFWDKENNPEFEFTGKKQYGFISQEVQKIIPEVVQNVPKPLKFDDNGKIIPSSGESILGLNYTAFIPINSAAIKELNIKLENKVEELNEALDKEQKANAALNERLTKLENCLSNILPTLCQMNQSVIQTNTPESQNAIRSQLSVKLNSSSSIVLDQNVPNPFAEQTVINFSIPETVQKAQIHFYNSEGRIIQSVDITERGLGSLTVFGSDLSSGIYTYTLVADGISVATKKMVKQ